MPNGLVPVARFDQRNCCSVHARTFVAHAAAVIDHQTHADGNIFALKNRELLFGFVFQNAEILFLEAVDETATIIQHSGVQNDEVHIDANLRIGRGRLTRR